jgi:hypothetical protein
VVSSTTLFSLILTLLVTQASLDLGNPLSGQFAILKKYVLHTPLALGRLGQSVQHQVQQVSRFRYVV